MVAESPRATTDRAWLVYLVVGLSLIAAYYLVPASGAGRLVRVIVYCVASASAAAAVLWGAARNRRLPRLPWILLGMTQVAYAMADACFYTTHYVLGVMTYPSFADLLYLAHYPLIVAGVMLLIRRRTPGGDLAGVLDAAVLAVVAGMFAWLYLIAPQSRLAVPELAELTSLACTTMDLGLLTVALRLILGPGRRPTSFWLIITNLFVIFAADNVYVLQQLAGTYHTGNFLDGVWLSGNLALGAAALHPTVAQLSERGPVNEQSLGPARIAALSSAAVVAPATLVVEHARGTIQDLLVVAIACLLLSILTMARLAGVLRGQRKLAITDSLTGLSTRRYFEAQLPLEVARARRADGSLAIFIIDVDHFKSVNDRYGHPAGDYTLTEIAARLRSVARNGDVLARYGGEEFALLVTDVGPEDLSGIAERLRRQVASSPIALSADTWVAVTISVGTASYPLHAETPSDLIAMADRALYAAKARGRDRIVVGDVLEPSPGVPSDHISMIEYLCHVADQVDARLSVCEHSRAIGRWAVRLSAELGHDEATTRRAEFAGRLHDIGKIVIPETILTKPAALSEEEWLLVRQHPDHGFRLARAVPGFSVVAEIIRQHHERYDGRGYPAKLVGRDIRVEARILAVCDAWAAMRSNRPYQAARSEDQAREQLRLGRSSQFDPDVVDLFLDLHRRNVVGEVRHIQPSTRGSRDYADAVWENGLVLPLSFHPTPGSPHTNPTGTA